MSTPLHRRIPRTARAAAAAVLALGGLTLAVTGDPRDARAQDFDINAVLYCEGKPIGNQTQEECEQARGLFLANCTACHSFVITVKSQKDEAGWDAFMNQHSGRVEGMSDEEVTLVSDFLKAHFNPDNPVPELPPALEALSDLPPA